LHTLKSCENNKKDNIIAPNSMYHATRKTQSTYLLNQEEYFFAENKTKKGSKGNDVHLANNIISGPGVAQCLHFNPSSCIES